MTPDDAREPIGWRYDGPSAFSGLAEADRAEILSDLPAYAAANERGALAGCFDVRAEARLLGGARAGRYPPDALDVGLGLRLDVVGHGRGAAFVAAGPAYARDRFVPPPPRSRLSVAAWNVSAVRAYERAGFRAEARFTSPVLGAETASVPMTTPGVADADPPVVCTIDGNERPRPAPSRGAPPTGATTG